MLQNAFTAKVNNNYDIIMGGQIEVQSTKTRASNLLRPAVPIPTRIPLNDYVSMTHIAWCVNALSICQFHSHFRP